MTDFELAIYPTQQATRNRPTEIERVAEKKRRLRKHMTRVRLGLLGSGTVGEALQDILFCSGAAVAARAGLELEIKKIYTRRPADKKWYRAYPDLFTARVED